MAHKYLASGTPSYTVATFTIAGATMSVAFAAGDEGRAVVFRISTSIYYGQVKAVVSATSITLHASALSLPTGSGTIADLILVDCVNGHSYQDYLDRMAAHLQDVIEALSDDDQAQLLQAAVADYGEDAPQYVSLKVAGDGTQSYSLSTILGSQWKPGYTVVDRIEYPSGIVPPTVIDSGSWTIYDDGTAQDGSNLKLLFLDYTPSATEFFILRARLHLVLDPIAGANYPDTDSHFNNVALLASAYACYALAAKFAQNTITNVSGDSFNLNDKTDKYRLIARDLMKRYAVSVFGAEEPQSTAGVATVTQRIERLTSAGGSFLFH